MSTMDDINRLRALARSERIPIELIRAMQSELVVFNSEVKAILGEGHGFYHGIGALAAAINDRLQEALGACQEYESAIHDAADALEHGSS